MRSALFACHVSPQLPPAVTAPAEKTPAAAGPGPSLHRPLPRDAQRADAAAMAAAEQYGCRPSVLVAACPAGRGLARGPAPAPRGPVAARRPASRRHHGRPRPGLEVSAPSRSPLTFPMHSRDRHTAYAPPPRPRPPVPALPLRRSRPRCSLSLSLPLSRRGGAVGGPERGHLRTLRVARPAAPRWRDAAPPRGRHATAGSREAVIRPLALAAISSAAPAPAPRQRRRTW